MILAGMTLGAVLRQAPIDAREARILLAHCLGATRVQLITQSERVLLPDEAAQVEAAFQRRLAGEPIAYIVGEREFFGLPFYTNPDVLIPRPETELLVDLALERLPRGGRVLDLGTGSGAIAVSLAHARPDATVTALDLSARALDVARSNAQRHGTHVRFLLSNWFAAVEGEQFDLLLANPPYIVQDDVHLTQGDLRFEPVGALTDHGDGLGALRIIIASAKRHLTNNGYLLVEHGYDQADAVRALMAAQDLQDVRSWRDLADIERISGGRT